MTSIQAGIPINSPHVKKIDLSKLEMIHVSELDEKTYQSYIEGQERFLESKHSSIPDTSNDPAYKEYASVVVNGKTVAELDNHGFATTWGAVDQSMFQNERSGINGPALAQMRAEKIADALGGQVVMSSTAMTQSEFRAAPKAMLTVDYAALKDDPAYEQLLKTKQARTLFLAQQMGQAQADEPEKVSLETSNGSEMLDIDDYFAPKTNTGKINLEDIPLLIPSQANIDALSEHAAAKFGKLLDAYGISEAPETIRYNRDGQIKLPADYAEAENLKLALAENPAMARELSTINALASHNVGMANTAQTIGRAHPQIALNFSSNGQISVTANGKAYDARASERVEASASSNAEPLDDASSSRSDSVTEFLEYMEKTPEERYYEAILADKGLTKEELAALPPEERARIEAEIQAEIEERLEAAINDPDALKSA